jgi:SNF2 family DNA or RNA helicase/predicted RNA methylase
MFTERVRNDDLSTLVREYQIKLLAVLDSLLPLAPPSVDQAMVRNLLLPMVAQLAEQVARRKVSGTEADVSKAEHELGNASINDHSNLPEDTDEEVGGEIKPFLTPAARYKANLAAIELATISKTRALTKGELRKVRAFSGWGGLTQLVWTTKGNRPAEYSARLQKDYPAGFPKPDARQLLWEYYTPSKITEAIADLLRPVVNEKLADKGTVRLLEPSAGVGRFLSAFEQFGRISMTAVEKDEIGKRILQAAHPKAEVLQGFFEDHASDLCGRVPKFDLILSNPPYGDRAEGFAKDHGFANESRNVPYFLKRTTYAAAPGCHAVFIIPTSTMTGMETEAKELRRWLLKRWHLVASYRLPGSIWDGGAAITTDCIVLQRREHMLAGVCGADEAILEGNYYALVAPQNILGRETYGEVGRFKNKDTYGVVGEFTAFPPLEARPMYEGTDYAADNETPSDKVREFTVNLVASAAELSNSAVYAASKIGVMLRRFDDVVGRDPDGAELYQGELMRTVAWFKRTHGDPAEVVSEKASFPDVAYFIDALDRSTGDLLPRYTAPIPQTGLELLSPIERLVRFVQGVDRGRRGASLDALLAVLQSPPEPLYQPKGELLSAISKGDPRKGLTEYLLSQDYLVVAVPKYGESNIRTADADPSRLVLEWEPRSKVLVGNLHSKATSLQAVEKLYKDTVEGIAIKATLDGIEQVIPRKSVADILPEPNRPWIPVEVLQAWFVDPAFNLGKFPAEKTEQGLIPGRAYYSQDDKECATHLVSPCFTRASALFTLLMPEQIAEREASVALLEEAKREAVTKLATRFVWKELGYNQKQIEDPDQRLVWEAELAAINFKTEWRKAMARAITLDDKKVVVQKFTKSWKDEDDDLKNRVGDAFADEIMNAKPSKWDLKRAKWNQSAAYQYGDPTAEPMKLDLVIPLLSDPWAVFFGYLNNIGRLFDFSTNQFDSKTQKAEADAYVERVRNGYSENARTYFNDWLAAHPDQAKIVEEAYRWSYLAFVEPEWKAMPVPRWDLGSRTPAAYQWKSANKLVDQRGGLTALDVGLGKTTTALLATAIAKQRGLSSKACYVVPAQTLASLERDFANFLPDFRVVTVGKATVTDKNGNLATRDDTLEQRLTKYRAIQRGDYEIAIFTYETFMRLNSTLEEYKTYADNSLELARMVQRHSDAAKGSGKKGKKAAKGVSASDFASAENKALAFTLKVHLKRKKDKKTGTLSSELANDPFLFSDLGFDLLVIDEAQNFKSLYAPVSERTKGVPKFMNIPYAFRPWNLDLRCQQTRMKGGMVFFMSATPAKNSPLELFNMLMMCNPRLLEQRSLADTEAFISAFCQIEERQAFTQDFDKPKTFSVVTGFKNLLELQGLLREGMEIVFVEDVVDQMILKVPEGIVENIEIDPKDDDQGRWLEVERERLAELNGTPAAEIPKYGTGEKVTGGQAEWNKVIVINAQLMRILQGCVHPYIADQGGEDIEEEEEQTTEEGEEDEGEDLREDNPGVPQVRQLRRLHDLYAEHFGSGLDLDWVPEGGDPARTANPRTENKPKVSATGKAQFRYPECKKALAEDKFNPHTMKFDLIAQKILATRNEEDGTLSCGHIIFAEMTSAHACIERVLIDKGVAPERIKVMNALLTPTPVKKDEVSRAFCGQFDFKTVSWTKKPTCDVVIANSVAYEGINLQTRTCHIHHADLPWNPAILQQRNGRGVRQGNTLTRVQISFYVTNRSPEGLRLANIVGKRGWLVQLIKGNDRSTNNPFDDANDIPAELLVRCVFAKNQAEKDKIIAEAQLEAAKRAARALRAAAQTKFKAACAISENIQSGKGNIAELRAELQVRVNELLQYDPNVLPELADVPMLLGGRMMLPYQGGLLIEGRVRLRDGLPFAVERVVGSHAALKLGADERSRGFMWLLNKSGLRAEDPFGTESVTVDDAGGKTIACAAVQHATSGEFVSAGWWAEWWKDLSEAEKNARLLVLMRNYEAAVGAPPDLWQAILSNFNGPFPLDFLNYNEHQSQRRLAVVSMIDGVWTANFASPEHRYRYAEAPDWKAFPLAFENAKTELVGQTYDRWDAKKPPSEAKVQFTTVELRNGMIPTFYGGARSIGMDAPTFQSMLIPRTAAGAATFLLAGNKLWDKFESNERTTFNRLFEDYFGFPSPTDWRTKGGASLLSQVQAMREGNPRRPRFR